MNTKRLLGIVALMLVCVAPAKADLASALESMYMVTGNEPTIYQSQRRLGLDAGYVRLRAPVATYQVFNYTAPRFEAGCGGFDAYLGSFSFINFSEFTQMLRQIGANALGYAFKLALASMCGLCDSVLGDLGRALEHLNEIQIDTCKWGQGIAVDTMGALGRQIDQEYVTTQTNLGNVTDHFAAARNIFVDRFTAVSGGDSSGADPNNPKVGNITWNALNAADTASPLQFPDANGLSNIELMLNIAGTIIVRGPSADDLSDGNEGMAPRIIPATMTYDQFKNGMQQNVTSDGDWAPLQTCSASAPRCLEYAPLAQWGLENGIRGWVDGRLEAAAEHMANPATAGTDHPADLQTFLASLPFPVMNHLQELQGNRAGLERYVALMGPYITEFYAPSLAQILVRTVEQAYLQPEIPEMSSSVKENLQRFNDAAVADMRRVEQHFGARTFEAEDFVERATRSPGDPGTLIRRR